MISNRYSDTCRYLSECFFGPAHGILILSALSSYEGSGEHAQMRDSLEPSLHSRTQSMDVDDYSDQTLDTVKPVLVKTKFLMENGSYMKVECIAECSPLGAFCNTFDLY